MFNAVKHWLRDVTIAAADVVPGDLGHGAVHRQVVLTGGRPTSQLSDLAAAGGKACATA